MNIEISKHYNAQEDYFRLQLNLEFEDDQENDEITTLLGNSFRSFPDVLREEFKEHGNLYKIINEKYLDEKYAPDSYYFHESDRGFRSFVKDMDDRELRQLTEIFTSLIMDKAEYFKEMFARETSERLNLKLGEVEEAPVELETLGFKRPSVIIADNKAYAFELKEVKDIKSIGDIEKEVYETALADMNKQMLTRNANYERRIKRLKEKFDREKNELFAEILKNSKDIFQNWEFVEFEGDLHLKFKERIVTTKVSRNGFVYDYPGEPEYKELYVTGLKVKVVPFVRERDVKITRGVNVHFRGSTGCIGTLNGQPLFKVLRDLPKALEIANMDSPLNDDVASYVRRHFLRPIEDNNRQEEVGQRTTWQV